MPVHFQQTKKFELSVPVVVVGGGACGLIAALAARDLGLEVLLVEREDRLGGSTSLAPCLIPAAFTKYQTEAGVADSPQRFAADIQRRSKGGGDVRMVLAVTRASGPTVEWLGDRHGIPWVLDDAPPPPGHSARRMHTVPERSGVALIERLWAAARKAGVAIYTGARVADLFATEEGRLLGVAIDRSMRTESPGLARHDEVGVQALILACAGFGANANYVRRFVPEMTAANFMGHRGSTGDALQWGTLLGAGVEDLGAFEAHASLSLPQGTALSTTLLAEGGFKVNARGERFVNEDDPPSELAIAVLNQPETAAWDIFDERVHRSGMMDEGYRQAYTAGAIRRAETVAALAKAIGVPEDGLGATFEHVRNYERGKDYDLLGRDFSGTPPLAAPFYGVQVGAAFIQNQGGLAIDPQARVLRSDGTAFVNLFAAGNAACGISGPRAFGYLAGNGLLAAAVLGRIAGLGAARSNLGAAEATEAVAR
jgi:fumarate reductase flavoprotein subunit